MNFEMPCLRGGLAVILGLTLVSGSGDERIRTADPLRAKQVLSQLSYAPEGMWARADLNSRPHAYQACALTS